jgi:hypothetical protein
MITQLNTVFCFTNTKQEKLKAKEEQKKSTTVRKQKEKQIKE